MNFEWDEVKNETNIQRHAIDFADVPALFNTLLLTELDDRFDYGENRWLSIGLLGQVVVVVVWTDRDVDTIRIISARKANSNERKRYEAYLTNRLGTS